jgi:hypothetical protein
LEEDFLLPLVVVAVLSFTTKVTPQRSQLQAAVVVAEVVEATVLPQALLRAEQ